MKSFKLTLLFLASSLLASILLLATPDMTNAQEQCKTCHGPIVEQQEAGPHKGRDCASCHPRASEHLENPSVKPGYIVEGAKCGECHKPQYESYMAVNQVDQQPQKAEKFPLLPKLLSGHAFAKDYREPREHFNMVEDINLTTRKRAASCYSCKSADFWPKWGEEITFDSDVEELLTNEVIKHPISCNNCHNPHNGETKIRNEFLQTALDKSPEGHPGKKAPVGNLLCSQCHVNYNFNLKEKVVEFPYAKVADMPEYMASTDVWKDHPTGSWEHPETGIRLYKVQHPEAELYWESIHDKAGVTCTDCHMPKVTKDGVTYTNHWITSPFNNPLESCAKCHQQSADELRNSVEKIQEDTYSLMKETMDTMSTAIDEIQKANGAERKSEDLLTQAKDNYFAAHLNWEWIAAENSIGFHNKSEAAATLTKAKESAEETITLAQRAVAEPDYKADEKAPAAPAPAETAEKGFDLWWIIPIALVLAAVVYFLSRRKV